MRFILATLVITTFLLGTGHSLNCYVCTPDPVGDESSRIKANDLRGNISQTFIDYSLHPCANFDPKDTGFQIQCPYQVGRAACIVYQTMNWVARTCVDLATTASLPCETKNGLYVCMCDNDLCNLNDGTMLRSTFAVALVAVGVAIATITAL